MHTLVADEDFLDLLNTWKLPRSWSLHCSEVLSKVSRVSPILPQDNYSNPIFFHYTTTLGKTSTTEVFPFLICNSLHSLQWPQTQTLLYSLSAWWVSLLAHAFLFACTLSPSSSTSSSSIGLLITNHHLNLVLKLLSAVLMDFAI